ncbi:MAG: hypothetical protein KAQ88_08485 [Hyphomicrobiaceae bacterium]|nr:hypothetical protein [Hyphomicrobiaceae bacterium]
MTQEDQAISRAEAKVFVISAIVLSATVCSAAFWYGVFGTIFFTHLLYVWVAATAALLASLFLPQMEMPLANMPWRGRFLLALPTVWLVLSTFIDVEAYRPDSPGTWVLWVVTLASAFLTLPYLLYVIIVAVVPDIDRLTHTKLRVALLGILLVTGMAGFVIGKNHSLFLTCEDFKVGGHDIPANCRKAGEAAH